MFIFIVMPFFVSVVNFVDFVSGSDMLRTLYLTVATFSLCMGVVIVYMHEMLLILFCLKVYI